MAIKTTVSNDFRSAFIDYKERSRLSTIQFDYVKWFRVGPDFVMWVFCAFLFDNRLVGQESCLIGCIFV